VVERPLPFFANVVEGREGESDGAVSKKGGRDIWVVAEVEGEVEVGDD